MHLHPEMITTRDRFKATVSKAWDADGLDAVNPYQEGTDLHADWEREINALAGSEPVAA